MRRFDAAAAAASWKRPYSSVEWAWVRALRVEPSRVWREERQRARRKGPSKRELRECFANERRVLV